MSDKIAAVGHVTVQTAVVEFDEPAAPASIPMPEVPAMPANFVPPRADEHLRPDATRGADAIA